MKLSFLDDNPIRLEEIKKIQAVGHDLGAALYSIDFQRLIDDHERIDAFIFLYEEMDRLANLYLILIKLGFLNMDSFENDRMIEHVISPLLRSVLEGSMKVRYVFAGLEGKNDVATIEDRFKDICYIFVQEYNKFYDDSINLGYDHMVSQVSFPEGSYNKKKLNNFFLIKEAVVKEKAKNRGGMDKITPNDENEIARITQVNYMQYTNLCLHTHGNLSSVFRNRFNIEKSFGYNHVKHMGELARVYISILIKFGLNDEEALMLEQQVIKYKN